MKRKAILSLMLVAVLMIGASLGTYAWFTSTATSSDSQFSTGTLKLATEGKKSFDIVEIKELLQTGAEIETEPIIIENKGNLDLAMFKRFNMSGSTELAKKIKVTKFVVNDWSAKDEDLAKDANLSLYDLVNWESEVSSEHWTVLGLREGQAQTIELKFMVDEDAGNEIQGKGLTLSMEILATQMKAGAIKALNTKLELLNDNLFEEIPYWYYREGGYWNKNI